MASARPFILVSLAVSLAACGTSDSGSQTVTLANMPGLLAEVQCDKTEACDSRDYYVRAGCISAITVRLADRSFALAKEAIANGRVRFNAEAARACLDTVRASSCEDLAGLDPYACYDAFEGLVAVGSACAADYECADGAFCTAADDCEGICKQAKLAGESCVGEDFDFCRSDLDCNGEICVELPEAGAACDHSIPCVGQLICADDSGKTAADAGSTCQYVGDLRTLKEGDECGRLEPTLVDTPVCRPELACVWSPDGESATCQARLPAHAECAYESGTSPCARDHYCTIDINAPGSHGTCEPLPAEGMPCTGVNSPTCRAGLVCNLVSRNCEQPARLGEACSDRRECASNLCEGGVCVSRLMCAGQG